MSDRPSTLLIPVENQVRELDAKLLLACLAAQRGYPVLFGSRAYCHFAAAAVPRGVYLAKSMRSLSGAMFRILRLLGHAIVCWEEEALVHPPPEIYFGLRLSAKTVGLVSHVFAWGQENFDLLQQYPQLPENLPIHITGNPRGDLLRPELRSFFNDEVARLRREHGDFLLINTNFSDVNPFIPAVGLFLPAGKAGEKPRFGQAGKGMGLEFAEGLRAHKRKVMAAFLELLPALARAFPDLAIVLRPHPAEKHEVYQQLASRCRQVRVLNQGNVVPWLLAAKALLHNGCTTGLEAYLLGVPAISHLPDFDERYDYDFQGLPTKLSHESFSFEELTALLRRVLAGELGAASGAERQSLADHYLAAQDGPLACERILDVLDAAGYRQGPPPAASAPAFAQGWLLANLKAGLTKLNMRRPGPNRQAYHDHRFPELSVADLEGRAAKFGELLNRCDGIRIRPHSRHLFWIAKDRAN